MLQMLLICLLTTLHHYYFVSCGYWSTLLSVSYNCSIMSKCFYNHVVKFALQRAMGRGLLCPALPILLEMSGEWWSRKQISRPLISSSGKGQSWTKCTWSGQSVPGVNQVYLEWTKCTWSAQLISLTTMLNCWWS